MNKTKYTQEQIDALTSADAFLSRTAKEKYTDYKSKDPFPKVGEALLNSADLLMYILTVGLIEPFCVDNLKGVTYACTFSGEAHRFDSKTGGMKEINLDNNEELILEQNSITYLKIEEKFHVPEYMVLRFNLSVSNAYKGVLLGTGPIVDPGFEGNLFIPLHNLTGNKYTIKKGASLIRVEFTKLSRHIDWDNKRIDLYPLLKPITKSTPKNAGFSEFIEEALLDSGKKKFYTSGVSVRSSIPEAIKKSAEQAASAEKTVKQMKTWGIMGILVAAIGIVVTVFSLLIPTWQAFDSFDKERSEYQNTIIQFEEVINDLEHRLIPLEISVKQEELDTIQKKLDMLYSGTVDKNSDVEINFNEQISYLQDQIVKLAKEIDDLQKKLN